MDAELELAARKARADRLEALRAATDDDLVVEQIRRRAMILPRNLTRAVASAVRQVRKLAEWGDFDRDYVHRGYRVTRSLGGDANLTLTVCENTTTLRWRWDIDFDDLDRYVVCYLPRSGHGISTISSDSVAPTTRTRRSRSCPS